MANWQETVIPRAQQMTMWKFNSQEDLDRELQKQAKITWLAREAEIEELKVIGNWMQLSKDKSVDIHNLDKLFELLQDLRRRGWLSPRGLEEKIAEARKVGRQEVVEWVEKWAEEAEG